MNSINDKEFAAFQQFIYKTAGITLSSAKKALVTGRLGKRLHQFNLGNYTEYLSMITGGNAAEAQIAVDLLTTNETYFFREPKHFDFLREQIAQAKRGSEFRVWSAASSTGEEAYSIAMVLDDMLKDSPWQVIGTDISTRVIQRARVGHYPMERATHVPKHYLQRYCLRGTGAQAGTLLIDKTLRKRVQFVHANLNAQLPQLGSFDLIFLRNVLIYFNKDTKQEVVNRTLGLLKPGGHFMIGHSETLNDIATVVRPIAPSIYCKL